MKLKNKLVGLVGVLVAITFAMAAMGWVNARNTRTTVMAIADQQAPLVTTVSQIAARQLEQSIWLVRGSLAMQIDNLEGIEAAAFEFNQLTDMVKQEMAGAVDQLTTMSQQADQKQVGERQRVLLSTMQTIGETYNAFVNEGSALLELMAAAEFGEVESRMPDAEIMVEEMGGDLQALNIAIGAELRSSARDASNEADQASLFVVVSAIAALILSILLGTWLIRSISRQLGSDPAELLALAKLMSRGDLSMQRSGTETGVHAEILRTAGSLAEVITGINRGAYEVGVASAQVVHGNTDLSSRTQEQASSLEEVAASMEEMTGTVAQNAESASRADQLAREAREKAGKGREAVEKTASAMAAIGETGSRISEILEMIQDIAFQTNLLALNAAVEAARAGEHGRGFAVVATEVRSLANRSSVAAKDIKSLVEESTASIDSGLDLAGESGDDLKEIVESVRTVSDIVTEIAAASREQTDGINQVNKAVVQMEGMTQQNAALVEEASAASHAMGQQAEQLRDLVAYFQIGTDAEGTATDDKPAIDEAVAAPAEDSNVINIQAAEANESPALAEKRGNDSDWTRF